MASTPDMENGFSRQLFLQWASNSKNNIILTSKTSPGTLARDLIDNGGNRNIALEVKERVKLEGQELEYYLKKEKERQEQLEKEQKYVLWWFVIEVITGIFLIHRETCGSDSEDDVDDFIKRGQHDYLVVEKRLKRGFFKPKKRRHLMIPFEETEVEHDDFGEIIKYELTLLDYGFFLTWKVK